MSIKKIKALILSLYLVFATTGCGSESAITTWYEDGPLPKPVEIPHGKYIALDHEMRDISSWELVNEIQTGWNL